MSSEEPAHRDLYSVGMPDKRDLFGPVRPNDDLAHKDGTVLGVGGGDKGAVGGPAALSVQDRSQW
jgi:hypothetical protein